MVVWLGAGRCLRDSGEGPGRAALGHGVDSVVTNSHSWLRRRRFPDVSVTRARICRCHCTIPPDRRQQCLYRTLPAARKPEVKNHPASAGRIGGRRRAWRRRLLAQRSRAQLPGRRRADEHDGRLHKHGAARHGRGDQAPSATSAPSAVEAKVSISNFAFDPAALTIKVGTTVTWTNNDVVAHTVTFTDVANSPVLNRGDQFSRTFTKPGTYSYICSIHPFMHGMVVVTP